MKRIGLLFSLVVASAAAGCGPGSTGNKDAGGGDTCDGATYPCSNVGNAVGKTIANLSVAGTQRDDNKDGNPLNDPLRTIELKEYYADKNIKVLAILTAAEWCVPCQQEQPELVAMWNEYKTKNAGVAMLLAVLQKQNSSKADTSTMSNWATRYKVPFDVTYDAADALAPYYDPMTFPSQIVIRTCDMSIHYMNNGFVQGALKRAIDAALMDPC